MNLSNILKDRKKRRVDILFPYNLIELNNKDEVGYAFKIYSKEEFNGDLSGIELLLEDNRYLVNIDLFVKGTDYKYKNLSLLKQFKHTTSLYLNIFAIDSVTDLNFILHLPELVSFTTYNPDGTYHHNEMMVSNRARQKFFRKIKYLININLLNQSI